MAFFLSISHRFPMRWTGFFRGAQALLDYAKRPPVQARLSRAVRRGDVGRLGRLLDATGWGLDQPLVPLPTPTPTLRHHTGHTLLHLAVMERQLASVKALIERGAQVDSTTAWGYTPAMIAAMIPDVEILHFLETQGANLGRTLPSMSTFVDDHAGPSIPELFESYAEESFESAKAGLRAESLNIALNGNGAARERDRL